MPRGHPYMQSRFTRTLPSWSGQLHTNRNTNTRMLSERVGGGIVGGNGYVVPSLPPTVSRLALPKLSQRIVRNAINAGVAEAVWRAISKTDGSSLKGPTTGSSQGTSVALNGQGDKAIVGSVGNGAVAYQDISGTWTQIGSSLNGPTTGSYSGVSVALNGEGDKAIVGSLGGGAVAYLDTRG